MHKKPSAEQTLALTKLNANKQKPIKQTHPSQPNTSKKMSHLILQFCDISRLPNVNARAELWIYTPITVEVQHK